MEKQEFEKSLTDSREYFEVNSDNMEGQITIFDCPKDILKLLLMNIS